jgi:FAD/FMN-containing dehydrogenase
MEGLKALGGGIYSNWNGVVKFQPGRFEAPTTLAELADIIKRSERVRLVGSGHSMNASFAAPPDTTLVQTHHLDRIEEPVREPDGSYSVWVECGATLDEIEERLAEHGLTLPSLPQSPKITIAGSMANGVHGSSFKESAVISDHALAMEVITKSGELRAVPPEDMKLARVSLGSLGAVARVKLRVVPNFYLKSSMDKVPGHEALEPRALRADLAAHDFQLLYTYDPVTRELTRRVLDRVTPEELADSPLPMKTGYAKREPGRLKLAALELGASLPDGLGRDWVKKKTREDFAAIEPQIGEARFMFQDDLSHPSHDMSYAVPIDRCREVLEKIADTFREMGYKPDLPLGVRFLKASDGTALAMNSGQDVAVIEFASLLEFDDSDKAREAFERIMTEAHARPHWGKEFTVNPRAAYPEKDWQAFGRLAGELGRGFANPWARSMTPAGGPP